MNHSKLQTPSRKQFSEKRDRRQLVRNRILIGCSTKPYLSTVTNFTRLVQKYFNRDNLSPKNIKAKEVTQP